MSCDGSGEMRWGHTCHGCDACEGRTTPTPSPAPSFWALAGGPKVPATDPRCPWCLTEQHEGTCPPDALDKARATPKEGNTPA